MAVTRLVAYLVGVASMGMIAQGAVGSALHDAVWTSEVSTVPGEARIVTETTTAEGVTVTRTDGSRERAPAPDTTTILGGRGPATTTTVLGQAVTTTVSGKAETVTSPGTTVTTTVSGPTTTATVPGPTTTTTVPGPVRTTTVAGPAVTTTVSSPTETVTVTVTVACDPPPRPSPPPCPPHK